MTGLDVDVVGTFEGKFPFGALFSRWQDLSRTAWAFVGGPWWDWCVWYLQCTIMSSDSWWHSARKAWKAYTEVYRSGNIMKHPHFFRMTDMAGSFAGTGLGRGKRADQTWEVDGWDLLGGARGWGSNAPMGSIGFCKIGSWSMLKCQISLGWLMPAVRSSLVRSIRYRSY